MAKKVKVTTFNEIPEGDLKRVKVGEQDIAIFKISGQIYALSNICTHEGCYLNEAHQMHFDVIECTCHGAQFDVKTGEVILPPATEKLRKYKTEVLGDDVYVEV